MRVTETLTLICYTLMSMKTGLQLTALKRHKKIMYLHQACSNVNYFPQKAVLVAELKKLESRNLNRKINIT